MNRKNIYIISAIALGVILFAIIAVWFFKGDPASPAPEFRSDEWIAASSTEAFIAYFPGQLEKIEKELPTPEGTFIQRSYTAGDSEKAIFTVVTTDYKVDLEGADQAELLKAALGGMVQADKDNRLDASSPATLNGRPALDFEIKNLASGISYRGLLVIQKSVLYQLFISYIGEAYPEKDYNYFVESFEFKA